MRSGGTRPRKPIKISKAEEERLAKNLGMPIEKVRKLLKDGNIEVLKLAMMYAIGGP